MDNFTGAEHKPLFRRRNSIASSVLVPTKLSLPSKLPHRHSTSFPIPSAAAASTSSSSSSSSQSFADFELISIRPISCYTSLKDLFPSTAVNSPTAASAGGQISIRNRLVKQAAWAYLQPMSSSQDYSGRGFLHRMWARISAGDLFKNPFADCFSNVIRVLTRALDRVLRAIRIGSSRYR